MSRINVLHVVQHSTGGGIITQLSAIVRLYDRQTVHPIVCSIGGKGRTGELIEKSGIEFIVLHVRRNDCFRLRAVWSLCGLMRDRKIHVVRTHGYGANLNGRIAAWLCRIPCILPSVHNVYTKELKTYRRIANRLLGGVSDRIIAVSEAVKRDIMRYDGISENKIDVIYNGIEPERFVHMDGDTIRREFGISSSAMLVGTVGGLTTQKGHKYLIEAIAGLKKKFPDIMLIIVGDGRMRDELKEYARTLAVDENVIFSGWRTDIPEILAAMDIFVFPSLWEGLGNALIEAMAAGKPIVATDIPPVREIFGSKTCGILVPVRDSGALAASIGGLLSDQRKAGELGNAAKQRATGHFSIRKTVAAYTALFENILGRKRVDLEQ